MKRYYIHRETKRHENWLFTQFETQPINLFVFKGAEMEYMDYYVDLLKQNGYVIDPYLFDQYYSQEKPVAWKVGGQSSD